MTHRSSFKCTPNILLLLMAIIAGIWLTGCASLSPSYQKPQVNLVNITPLPANGLEQRFSLKLRVTNPNQNTLAIKGIAFNLLLQGHQVLSGVSSDTPAIKGYSESEITLVAATSLLGGLKVLGEMLANPNRPFAYELETRIDTGWWLYPITVTETGSIALNQPLVK